MKNLITILCLCLSLKLVLGCIDGEEVELWGECYNIKETTELDLSYNQLSGEIPSDIGGLTNLIGLWLNDNQLSGEIPLEIGNLTNLQRLDLDWNSLTGEIPPEIGSLINLAGLNLSLNQLIGLIPETICNQGTHSITWDGTGFSSGQYPVKMESGSFSKTKIISLVK